MGNCTYTPKFIIMVCSDVPWRDDPRGKIVRAGAQNIYAYDSPNWAFPDEDFVILHVRVCVGRCTVVSVVYSPLENDCKYLNPIIDANISNIGAFKHLRAPAIAHLIESRAAIQRLCGAFNTELMKRAIDADSRVVAHLDQTRDDFIELMRYASRRRSDAIKTTDV